MPIIRKGAIQMYDIWMVPRYHEYVSLPMHTVNLLMLDNLRLIQLFEGV